MSICTSDPLLSRTEAAQYIGVQAQTLAMWAMTGKYDLPCIKVGGRARYRFSALEKWLESRTVGAVEK